MVVYYNLSVPQTQTANTSNTVLGTVNVPYNDPNALKQNISISCPIGFSLYGNLGIANPSNITVSNMIKPTTINVFKNGTLITTVNNLDTNVYQSSKIFILANTTGVISFNSFFYNISCQYSPLSFPTVGNTDVYTFTAPITYTLSGNSVYSFITNPCYYGIVFNTTTSTSAFTNFGYFGSSDTNFYTSYSIAVLYSLLQITTSNLTATGTSTLATTNATALNVSGTSTLATTNATALNVSGTSTLATTNATALNVSGTSTLASPPTMSYSTLPTLTSNQIGYTISTSRANGAIPSTTNLTLSSLSLTSGVWILTSSLYINGTGTFSVSISTISTGDVGQGYINYYNTSTYNIIPLTYIVNLSATTTYYHFLYTGNATSLALNFFKATRLA